MRRTVKRKPMYRNLSPIRQAAVIGLVNFIVIIGVSAQGLNGPGPDATAMMRQVHIGVNQYSGSADISIPLVSISGKELSLPVTLSYNTQGNKVQDIPSSVGLGWSMFFGGMITRIVRGVADNLTDGYCTANKTDPEPDLYIFSIPGRTGKFSLDRNGVPVIFPYQDLRIIPGICRPTVQTWEIIDENGIRYQFGNTTATQEITTVRPVTGGATSTYVSTWYITKIISPNGTDEISFSYVSSAISFVNHFYTKDDVCTQDASIKNLSQSYSVAIKNVNTISSSGGNIFFSWGSDRQDVAGGRYLSSVRVVNNQGAEVSKLRFVYGYFEASGCGDAEQCKRLRLDNIADISSVPLYRFSYNTIKLPSRYSKNFDHWGYYNGNTVDSWLPADYSLSLPGASREPDLEKMQAAMLERIDQKSGSHQRLVYEPHEALISGSPFSVSGVRVKRIEAVDQGGTYTTSYSYTKEGSSTSSGVLFRVPSYSVYGVSGSTIIVARRFSHSYTDLFDVNGLHVGYSRVEESSPGKGKVVSTFSNYDTRPDQSSGDPVFDVPPFASMSSRFWERGNLLSRLVLTDQNHPVTRESFEYNYNIPAKKTISGSKSMRIDYNGCGFGSGYIAVQGFYDVVSRPFTLARKTTDVFDQTAAAKKATTIEEYGYDPTLYQLISTKSWNAAAATEKYMVKIRYITDPLFNYDVSASCSNTLEACLSSCNGSATCVDLCNDEYNTCMAPSSDKMVNATAFMRARHMQNTIVERQNILENSSGSTLLSASLNLYERLSANSDIVIAASMWNSSKISGPFQASYVDNNGNFIYSASFVKARSFDYYDQNTGKLLQQTSRDGIRESFIWGYNNTLVQSSTLTGGSKSQTTNLEYRPLVGLTKQTDANGSSASTEYDKLGRMRIQRNTDGDIVQRLRYHHQTETPNFQLSSSHLITLANQSITFTASDFFLPTGGSYTISWNMGDGRTFNDNRTSFSVTYPAVGVYTVTASLATNEFPLLTKTLTIRINQPLQISVCLDGPMSIDICGVNAAQFGSCTVNNTNDYSDKLYKASINRGTGCGTVTYNWEYQNLADQVWYSIGSGAQAYLFVPSTQVASYSIRCTATDACGTVALGYGSFTNYKSSSNCSPNPPLAMLEVPEEQQGGSAPIALPPGVAPNAIIMLDKTDN